MKVAVYWNLHRACWSIQSREGLTRGRVIAHAAAVGLKGCQFKVSEAGRQRVLREKRKNVHAFVVGELIAYRDAEGRTVNMGTWPESLSANVHKTAARYNPYRFSTFVDDQGEPLLAAEEVHMRDDRSVVAWAA